MSICFGGFCIPCSILWPLVLLAIKPIYEYLANIFGWPSFDAATKKKCDDKKGCCPFSGKEANEGEKECPGAKMAAANKNKSTEETVEVEIVETSNYTVLTEGQTLEEFIGQTERVYVKFTAQWCKPCKEVEPHFVSLAAAHPQAQFINVDIDTFDEYALKYVGMAGIPLFVALDRAGEQLGQQAGKDREKLTAFVETHAHK